MAATIRVRADLHPEDAPVPERLMSRCVSLVDADPDLVEGIPEDDHALAERVLTRPLYEIPKGRWAPELLRGHDSGGFALLVVDGVITRQLEVADRTFMQILGSGDVLKPVGGGLVFERPLVWTAFERSSVVVLDERFKRASQRWPSLSVNLYDRLLEQADRATLHAAIVGLPRVERRVLAIFWQLAEKWGRVTPFGVEVPLRLTHEAIGRLAGAQRPTVTLALRDLCDEGAMQRNPRGGWLLNPDARMSWREPALAVSQDDVG
jgi:hypothetical protein